MLGVKFSEQRLTYYSSVSVEPGPTRYDSEFWARMASDLICGVADCFQDVGIVVVGEPWITNERSLTISERRWANISSFERRTKSVWCFSDVYGWLFVPSCREAVEDVMSWTMPYARDGGFTEPLSAAFLGLHHFRSILDEATHEYDEVLHALVDEHCITPALFTMKWAPASWSLYPGQLGTRHLLKLADPVASRINAVTSE